MSQPKECLGSIYLKEIELADSQNISLVTVFAISGSAKAIITEEWVREIVESCKSTDDVFHEAFLAGVMFYGIREDEAKITDQARMYLSNFGNKWIKYVSSADTDREVLPGPYVLLKNQLRDVWRLVDDVNRTCMVTLRPQPGSDSQSLSIALPSRLRSQQNSANSTIAGWRVVVKDNIHMQGIKTSLGNRGFYDTYPPQPQTADCIQRLMDLGVVILGKAKMTSFANWEEPVEYIDYQAPWNDRADHYQSPGGSSSGSASAISAYNWLDIAIGTDTIVWPKDFWSIIDSDQCDLALKFVKDMESHLGLQYCEVSFDDIWKAEPPHEASGLSLIEFMGQATAALAYDGYHNCDDFLDRYRREFHHAPHISLPTQKLWEEGQKISKMERDDGFNKIEIYVRWMRDRVLTGDRANAFVVLPLENMSPRYRDEIPKWVLGLINDA
ncbi:unnamed protein product [Penicillium manginii]